MPGAGHVLFKNAPVGAWPALSTTVVERTQAFGMVGACTETCCTPDGETDRPKGAFGSMAKLFVRDAWKWGRTQNVTARRAPTYPTSVVAMAGRVLRKRIPVVAPRAKAKSA